MAKLFILLLLSCCFYSCNFSEREASKKQLAAVFKGADTYEESVDPLLLPLNVVKNNNLSLQLEKRKGVDVGALVDSVSYIPLETNKNILIGNIDRVFFHKNRILIVDRSKAKGIFIFDMQGKFLNKIQHIGHGPGEYSEITDAALNFMNDEITLFDLRRKRLLFYDLNGRFLRDQRIYFQFNQLAWLPDGNAVLLNYSLPNFHIKDIEDFNLLVVDKNFNLLYKSDPFNYEKDMNFRAFWKNHLVNVGGDVYYFPRYKDSVIKITGAEREAKYHLDFGSRKIPSSFWNEPADAKLITFLEAGNVQLFNGMYTETDKAAFFQAAYNGGNHYVFYFLKSHKIVSGSYLTGESKDVFMLPAPVTNYKNEFVSILYPYQLSELKNDSLATLLLKNKSDQVRSLIGSVKETDNPILMLFTVKDVK